MWNRLIAFLAWPVLGGNFSHAFLGGGYVSATPRPRDVDLILQTRESYGPEAFRAIEPYFRKGLEPIYRMFGIHLHFWMENAPPSFTDYRTFFQYERPSRQMGPTRKGLILISLLGPDIRTQMRELLGGFEISNDSPDSMPPGPPDNNGK